MGDIRARLERMLGSTDPTLGDALDDAVEMILDYCALECIPTGLESTVVALAAELWRWTGYGSERAPVPVASVSRGDVSTSFAVKAGFSRGAALERHRDVLNGFRRVRRSAR